MKIYHVLASRKLSGAERLVMDICNNQKMRNRVIYVSPVGQILDSLKQENIEFNLVKKLNLSLLKRFRKLNKSDIIHAHDFRAAIIVGFSSHPNKIMHIHQSPNWLAKNSFLTFILAIVFSRFKKVIICNGEIEISIFIKKILKNKLYVLENQVDMTRILNMSEDYIDENDYLLYLGRLNCVKDPMRLIRIFEKALLRDCKLKLVIVGDGNLREEVEREIENRRLGTKITLVGFSPNPYPYIKQCRRMILTSKSEGLPIVLKEAEVLGKDFILPELDVFKKYKSKENIYVCSTDDEFVDAIISKPTGCKEGHTTNRMVGYCNELYKIYRE